MENQHFEPLLCSVFALYRQTETVVLNIEKSHNKTIILGIIKCVNIYSSRIPIYIMCYIEKYLDKTVKFVIHCLRQTDIEYTDIVIFNLFGRWVQNSVPHWYKYFYHEKINFNNV